SPLLALAVDLRPRLVDSSESDGDQHGVLVRGVRLLDVLEGRHLQAEQAPDRQVLLMNGKCRDLIGAVRAKIDTSHAGEITCPEDHNFLTHCRHYTTLDRCCPGGRHAMTHLALHAAPTRLGPGGPFGRCFLTRIVNSYRP